MRVPYQFDVDIRRMEQFRGVYCIFNANDGSHYVGQSEFVPYRWQGHRAALRNKHHYIRLLQFDYCVHGPKVFCFIALEKTSTVEQSLERERWWINYYREQGGIVHNVA